MMIPFFFLGAGGGVDGVVTSVWNLAPTHSPRSQQQCEDADSAGISVPGKINSCSEGSGRTPQTLLCCYFERLFQDYVGWSH